MNIDKIGNFICELRKEQKLTQDELAEKIHVSRQAVSKWERGITVPDSGTLILLSEIFDITINEILAGERINKYNEKNINNKVSLSLYADNTNKLKKIKILVFLIILIILAFLLYYFINSYRAIRVYTISGFGKNVEITNGIFVRTNEKLYFRIGDINTLNDKKIENFILYYNIDKVVYEILNSTNRNLAFVDYKGYDEYLDSSKLSYVLNNLSLKVKYSDETEEVIKLNLKEDYINDSFIFLKTMKIKNNDKKIIDYLNTDYNNIINSITKKYKKKDDTYIYSFNDEEEITIFYHPEAKIIKMVKFSKGKIIEEWILEINFEKLIYNNYEKNYNFEFVENKINCVKGECTNTQTKCNEFFNKINHSIK